ncbi:MAG: hypothetical protein KA063_04940 [Firmicutes bacterium]|nr:hypothetical protein [Bacillota bacterium]
MDVLIGNGDRHEDNFLFVYSNGSGEVIPIDHNMAFGADKAFASGGNVGEVLSGQDEQESCLASDSAAHCLSEQYWPVHRPAGRDGFLHADHQRRSAAPNGLGHRAYGERHDSGLG